MKVYVDELPKCCEECPCCNECMDYGISCNLDDIKLSYYDYAKKRHINCPLLSLADYTKQVRKEVLDEICVDYAKRLSAFIGVKISISTAMEKLKEILDQIQGE